MTLSCHFKMVSFMSGNYLKTKKKKFECLSPRRLVPKSTFSCAWGPLAMLLHRHLVVKEIPAWTQGLKTPDSQGATLTSQQL